MKRIAILGSTGSIGKQTLEVIAANPQEFKVTVLAAKQNDQLLEQQIKTFNPTIAVLVDEKAAKRLKVRYTGKTEILSGEQGLLAAAVYGDTDIVLTSMVGFAGVKPTIAAIQAGKDIALANKETLVAAGELVTTLARQHGITIRPVDSEHSAIWQCLQGNSQENIARVILTASGGPFRGYTKQQLEKVTVEACLKHPNWSMGKKITVDSATLMNKGFEVIEAKWLFNVNYDQVDVVVHPQSVIHSMVEYVDGAVMAQLGMPDMRLPIQYALVYPERKVTDFPRLNFNQIKQLTFEAPDRNVFTCLEMAYEAGEKGGTQPCVLNAANEVAVNAFLNGEIQFVNIMEIIKQTVATHKFMIQPKLEDLIHADALARETATQLIADLRKVKTTC